MDKIELLKSASGSFRHALHEAAADDGEAASMLENIEPLFADIAAGRVTPPAEGVYRPRLHSEHTRHGAGSPLFSAESAFVSALEDWRSKPWYPK